MQFFIVSLIQKWYEFNVECKKDMNPEIKIFYLIEYHHESKLNI